MLMSVCESGQAWRPMLLVVAVMAIGGAGARGQEGAVGARCRSDLAARVHVSPSAVRIVSTEAVTWPDAGLGLPQSGMAYAQAQTPGWRIVLEARSTRYVYTAGERALRYGGPVEIWQHSVVFVRPNRNEPNGNGTLMQASLLGTHEARIMRMVTEVYPQRDGSLLAKRRTSRSGFMALHLGPLATSQPAVLYAAFDFGALALRPSDGQWAGFVRPHVGGSWAVCIGNVLKPAVDPRLVALPTGAVPGDLGFSPNGVVLRIQTDGKPAYYEIPDVAAGKGLQLSTEERFAGLKDHAVTATETLVVRGVEKAEPSVEVGVKGSTGSVRLVARIAGASLVEYEMFAKRYVYVRAMRNGVPEAHTVDLTTGEVYDASVSGVVGARLIHRAPPGTPVQ